MIIKKWNSSNEVFDELYPKTTTNQIYGYNTATEAYDLNLFDIYGKLNEKYLPNIVFGGLNFKGVLNLSSTADAITNILYNWSATWQSEVSEGDYFQVGTAGKVTGYGGASGSLQAIVYDENGETYEGGSDEATEVIDVESGDWIVFTQKEVFVDGTTYTRYFFSIVNNEVAYATTTKYGLTRFATSTEVSNHTDVAAMVNPANVETIVNGSNSATTDALATPIDITLTGAVSGTVQNQDLSSNITISTTFGDHVHYTDDVTNGVVMDGQYQDDWGLSGQQQYAIQDVFDAIKDTRNELYVGTSTPTALFNNAIWFDLN